MVKLQRKSLNYFEDRVVRARGKEEGLLLSVCIILRWVISDGIEAFPSKVIWNSLIPPKVGIFACEVAW